MRLTDRGIAPAFRAGFSLLEVVIASGLLLVTVTAVTASVLAASRGGARLNGAMAVDRVLRAEAERLHALPFCAASYPAGTEEEVAGGDSADDLVADVFPHAVAAANRVAARYASVEGDAPAGAFVTVVEREGVTVERVARFTTADGLGCLGPAAVAGWAAWGDSPPPGPGLRVQLIAGSAGVPRRCVVVVIALPPQLAGDDPEVDP